MGPGIRLGGALAGAVGAAPAILSGAGAGEVDPGTGGMTTASGADPDGGNGGSAKAGDGNASAGQGGMTAMGSDHLGDWPDGTDPATIGLLLARRFDSQPADTTKHYKEACAWYGALDFAALLREDELIASLAQRYGPCAGTFDELLSGPGHVDENVFGIVPLELSMHDSDPSFLDEGLAIADHQIANLESQIRFAIDDMFMITGLQMQAFRPTGEARYRRAAGSTMVRYLDRLQQLDGTFYHHTDVEIRWARGNGWVAAGLTELMRELEGLSASNPETSQRIRLGYEDMMAGLLPLQIPEGQADAGLWKQVLDADEPGNYAETSGTAMFTYALVSGVKNGWLDADTYGPAARAGWLALVSNLEPDGQLRGVSDWAYKAEDGPATNAYYYGRGGITGDNHGQAPMMWAAAALLR